jgi:sulfur carrier protein
MRVVVNGSEQDIAEDATIADVVATVQRAGQRPRALQRAGMAVAVNGEVVVRRDWETTRLAPDDRIEVLASIQGG